VLTKAFGPEGGGMAEIEQLAATAREQQTANDAAPTKDPRP